MDDLDAVLDEIIALTTTRPRQPNEFTVGDLVQRSGLTSVTSQRKLVHLCDTGRLTRREGVVNQRRCWLYSFVED